MSTTEPVSRVDAFDELLFKFEHFQYGYETDFSMVELDALMADIGYELRALPNDAWTPSRIDRVLGIIGWYTRSSEDYTNPHCLFTLLNGKAPVKLVNEHIRRTDRFVSEGLLKGDYSAFEYEPLLFSDLAAWRKYKPRLTDGQHNWRCALSHDHTSIDWEKQTDPLATLLTLRRVWPEAGQSDLRRWWSMALQQDTKTEWAGTLCSALANAFIEDIGSLDQPLRDAICAKIDVDSKFLSSLLYLYTRQLADKTIMPIEQDPDFLLDFVLLNQHRLERRNSAGAVVVDNDTRRFVRDLNNFKPTPDRPQTAVLILTSLLAFNEAPMDVFSQLLTRSWKIVHTDVLSHQDREALKLVHENLDSLEVAKLCSETILQKKITEVAMPDTLSELSSTLAIC